MTVQRMYSFAWLWAGWGNEDCPKVTFKTMTVQRMYSFAWLLAGWGQEDCPKLTF